MRGAAGAGAEDASGIRIIDRECDSDSWERHIQRTQSQGGAAVALYPTQWAFLADRSPLSCCAGGFGSGKSTALVLKAMRAAQEHPGNHVLLARKSMPMAKLTTLAELERWLPPEWVRYRNQTTATWELQNGSTIQSRPLLDWRELQGLNCGDAFVDEGAEVSEKSFDTVTDRTRLAGYPCTVNVATNPAGRSHYLYKRTVLPWRQGKPGVFYCQGSSLENLSTSEQFRTSIMSRYSGDELARAVFGDWVNPSGLVWSNFGPHTVVPHETIDWSRRYVFARSIDFGFEHDFVCLWWAWTRVQVGHETADVGLVYREYSAKRRSMRQHAEAIYGAQEDDRQRGIMGYADTWLEWDNQDRHELLSLPELVRIEGRRARKERVAGHRSVQAGLLQDPRLAGLSRLYISDACPNTIGQVESYARPDGATREDQVVEFEAGESVVDHCDALRYGYHSHVRSDFARVSGYDPGMDELARQRAFGGGSAAWK